LIYGFTNGIKIGISDIWRAMVEDLIEFLLTHQNPDGGWGVTGGKMSNTESTSFSVMALSGFEGAKESAAVERGFLWLTECQNTDGSWPAVARVEGGRWVTALAVLALAQFKQRRSEAVEGARWLLRREGRGGWLASLLFRVAPDLLPTRVNPTLKGWPWTSDAFAWAEPTSYALMALKKLRPYIDEEQMDERIHQGELLLYDRACEDGGWNYGNPNVLGEALWPYPDVTAVALIALQDRMDEDINQTGLRALGRMLPGVRSGMTLSWSIICLSLYGHDVSNWRKKLTKVYEEHGFLDRIKSVALALLASGHMPNAFHFESSHDR
jgi:hypothetical protein